MSVAPVVAERGLDGGNFAAKGKGGPRADSYLEVTRSLFDDWSDRTQRIYARAWRLADALERETGVHHLQRAAAVASRPNGSLNVSKMARLIETQAVLYLMKLEAADITPTAQAATAATTQE